MLREKEAVDTEDVSEAIRNRVQEYDILLRNKQRDLLREIHRTKEIDNREEYRQLLHNLSVLEYSNGDIWYDVHPLVRELIEPSSQEGA